MKSIAAALLVLQGVDPSELHARVEEIERITRQEIADLRAELTESVRETEEWLKTAWQCEYTDYKDIRDTQSALSSNYIMLEDVPRYVEHRVPLAKAQEELDDFYEAAEVVQRFAGGHVGTAKGTLRQSGRRRGMGCLRTAHGPYESPKWDGYTRRSVHQSWKAHRGQQYRASAA